MSSLHHLRLPALHSPPFRPRAPPQFRWRRPMPHIASPALVARPNPKVRASDNSICVGRTGTDADGGGGTRGNGMDLPVELCVTYELEPAVTLREGVERIKEAVGRMRLEPPCSSSGVVRFEVMIPPSIKAANWFCSQCSSEVFPQFFVSAKHYKSVQLTSLYGMIGVAGVGAAIYLHDSSHEAERDTITRYLSVDSPLIRAYRFVGNESSKGSPSGDSGDCLHSIFIPQIELNEFEDNSILALTVVWDDCLCQSLPDAIKSAEFHLHRVAVHVLPGNYNMFYDEKRLPIVHGHIDVFSAKEVLSVYLNAENLVTSGAKTSQLDISALEQWKHYFQFYFRLSRTVTFTSNMITQSGRSSFPVNQCPNINSVWASLIVEECVRLGLVHLDQDRLHLQ